MGTDVYIPELVRALRELASESDQRRLWLGDANTSSPISSLRRTHIRLINKTGVGYELDLKRTMFDRQTDGLLRRLDRLLEAVDISRPTEIMIASDEMVDIRMIASELLKLVPHDDREIPLENPDFSN